jgi:hypothetical protein
MEAVRDSWTDDRLDDLNRRVAEGFVSVDRRFEQVDRRFEQIDQRFDQVDARFDRVENRLDRLDGRFERMDGKLDTIQHAIIYGFVGFTVAIIGGFAAIMGLIATQI